MLQQLYMIPNLRESLLRVDVSAADKEELEQNVLFQLQAAFANLKVYSRPERGLAGLCVHRAISPCQILPLKGAWVSYTVNPHNRRFL